MNKFQFSEGMWIHFCIKDSDQYVDEMLLKATGSYSLDVLKFDDFLHKAYGDYEMVGHSMSSIIRKKFGLDAQNWAIKALGVVA
jgi:hypothetical protein